jgi:phospholipid-translocating ATPase
MKKKLLSIKLFNIGFLFSYVAPLVFVLLMALLKEAYDDFKRYKRDKEANSQKYT